MKTLWDDGLAKAASGLTSLEELGRVLVWNRPAQASPVARTSARASCSRVLADRRDASRLRPVARGAERA